MDDLEEWEIIANEAEKNCRVTGCRQQVNTPAYHELQRNYRMQSSRFFKERSCGKPQFDFDLSAKNQAGWKKRRRVLNKLIELHEDHDDLDDYGFPCSGPFSLLSMKTRYPKLYDYYVGENEDIGMGTGYSEFGNVFYKDIAIGQTTGVDKPFERGGLIAKLAWGVLQKESYSTHKNDAAYNFVKETETAAPHQDHMNAGINDTTIWDDLPTEAKKADAVSHLSDPRAFDLAQAAMKQVTSSLKEEKDAQNMKQSAYRSRIVDNEAKFDAEQAQTERLRRLADQMKAARRQKFTNKEQSKDSAKSNANCPDNAPYDLPGIAQPQVDVEISEELLTKLHYFAEEVYANFVSGKDESVEDELNDLLKLNADEIQKSIDEESRLFESWKDEEKYFDNDD